MRHLRLVPDLTPESLPEAAPPRDATCFECQHYALVASAGHCSLFGDPIYSEIAEAAECPEFLPEQS